jgi:glycosyltransferase involved in cell wall biosynthesis
LKVTVVTHAVMVDGHDNFGPAHNVTEFFASRCQAVDLVLHPLAGRMSGVIRRYRNGSLADERPLRDRTRIGEAAHGFGLALHDPADVLIVIDPVNFATTGLLRRRGVVVYYTVDYADRRFANPWLNRTYHALDAIAVRFADVIWSVSQRVVELRRTQGVEDGAHFLVPNAPAFDPSKIVPFEQRPERVVFVGSLDGILDQTLLLDTLARLRALRPGVTATIVGTGPDEPRLRAELVRRGLDPFVELAGYRPHHEALELVRNSRAGIALYNSSAAWHEYRDSVKVREYLSLGVPVVTSGNYSLANEVAARGAGFIAAECRETAEALNRMLGADGPEFAKRAAQLGLVYDRDTLLSEMLVDLSRRVRKEARGDAGDDVFRIDIPRDNGASADQSSGPNRHTP